MSGRIPNYFSTAIVILGLFFGATKTLANDNFQFKFQFQPKPFAHKAIKLFYEPVESSDQLVAFGFTSDFADKTGTIYFVRWDLWTGKELTKIAILPLAPESTYQLHIRDVELTSDGKFALISGASQDIIKFDLSSHKVVGRYLGHRSDTYGLAVSEDAQKYAVEDSKGDIWVWNSDSYDMPQNLLKTPNRPLRTDFTSNPQVLRIYQPEFVQEWNWVTGKLISTIKFEKSIDRLTFAPESVVIGNNNQLFTRKHSKDGMTEPDSVIAIDASTGKTNWELTMIQDPSPFSGGIWSLGMTNNSRCLIVSKSDALLAIDTTSGKVLVETKVRVGSFDLSFDPSGRYLIYPSGVEIYELPAVCQ